MAHLVETMAYAGATPWHGLGNQLTQKQPIEVWQREAGMDWQILESPCISNQGHGPSGRNSLLPRTEGAVPFEHQNPAVGGLAALPHRAASKVLEFYRDLTEVSGYELETAIALDGTSRAIRCRTTPASIRKQ